MADEPDALVERLQPRHSALGVEKLRCAGEDPEQAVVAGGFVADLPDAVERLAPHVAAHAQDGLGLVDNDDETPIPRGLHDLEHTLEILHGVAARDVALDAGRLLGAGRHVAAPREPGDERPRLGDLPLLLEREDDSQHPREVLGRTPPGHGGDLLADLLAHEVVEALRVLVRAAVDQLVLDPSDPAVDDVAQGSRGAGHRGETLDHLAVELVELVEAQVVVRDHDEAAGEPSAVRVLGGQPRHEGLAAAVAAPEELEHPLAVGSQVEQPADLLALPLDAHGESIQSTFRHNARTQPLEDVLHVASLKSHLSCPL